MFPPETIHFNAIDRYFIAPETDDPEGVYFPMLVCGGVELSAPLEREQIVAALHRVNARYPQFRLGYRLDYRRDCWRKVADLDAHFDQIARSGTTPSLEQAVAEGVRANIEPFSCPVQATTYDRQFTLRLHHSFIDGGVGMKLFAHLLIAALDPDAYEHLPDIAMRYHLPLWRVVWNTPRQGVGTLWNWASSFKSSVVDFKGDGSTYDYTPEPIRDGTPVAVARYVLPRAMMSALGRVRRALSAGTPITLNTLIQVMIAHRLIELGLLPPDRPVAYMQLVDLHRYHPDSVVYGGNLAGQARLRILPLDLRADCVEFQTTLEAQLASGLPLATLPSEWLLALISRRLYRKINRDWLIESIHSDPQFFIFSNLGILDGDFRPAMPYIVPHTNLALSGSLIGAPPLRVLFAILGGEGHLGFTYNPRVLSPEQIEQIAAAFSPEWVEQKAGFVTA